MKNGTPENAGRRASAKGWNDWKTITSDKSKINSCCFLYTTQQNVWGIKPQTFLTK
ncbi:MAG: hypothetical protein WC470_02175 [Candidatus Paceibacterota bacterium]